MQFKNPYDEFNDLKDYERDFLKKILYEFHKIRCEMLGKTNDIKGPDDPKLRQRDKIPTGYFNAPLECASVATRRTQMDKGIKQWGKKMVRMFTKPKEYFEEMQGLIVKYSKQLNLNDNVSFQHPYHLLIAYNQVRKDGFLLQILISLLSFLTTLIQSTTTTMV